MSSKPPPTDVGFGATLTATEHAEPNMGKEATLAADSAPGSATQPTVNLKVGKGNSSGSVEDFAELVSVDPDNYVEGDEIDRGGMGRVVRARDRRLGRDVAVKQLLRFSPDHLRRFEREARITAGLQHPSIVTLHEAGKWHNGSPFYAMGIVNGQSFSEILEGQLDLDDRLALLPKIINIADALAYAHGQRIIHRDLKPSNVLIGRYGETVVIDWGLAKKLGDEDSEDVGQVPAEEVAAVGGDLTVAGAVMGTPAYMSPEQALGENVDERTDVYAIGAILYHTLTGTPPFTGSSAAEIISKVSDGAPRATTLQRGIPDDLRTILEKAMHRDVEERYPTALELSNDLNRFRRGQLVGAHSYTTRELMWRWIGRHKAVLLVATAAALVAAGTLAVSFQQIVGERDRAEVARVEASDRANDVLLEQAMSQLQSDPPRALATLARLPASATAEQWQRAQVIALAAQFSGLPAALATDLQVRTLRLVDSAVLAVDAKQHVYEIPLDGSPAVQRVSSDDKLAHLALAEGGDLYAVGTYSGAIQIRRRSGGDPSVLRGHEGILTALAFSRDGERLLSTGLDSTLRIWNLADNSHQILSSKGLPMSARFSRDGELVAAGSTDGLIRIWSSVDGSLVDQFDSKLEGVRTLSFDPSGASLAYGGEDGAYVYYLDSKDSQKLAGNEEIFTLRYLPSGLLVTAGADRSVRIWNSSLERLHTLSVSMQPVYQLDFSRGGDTLVATALDGSVHAWRVNTDSATELLKTAAVPDFREVTVSEDARQIAVLGLDRVSLWDLDTDSARIVHLPFATEADSLRYSESGATLAIGSGGNTVHLLAHAETEPIELEGESPSLVTVPLDQHGVALTCNHQGQVTLWKQRDSHQRLAGIARPDLVVSPNQRIVASGGGQGEIRLWDLVSGEARILPDVGTVLSLQFSRSGRYLAGAVGTAVLIWDMSDGALQRLEAHSETITSLQLSPSATCLVSGSNDGSVRIWDRASGRSKVIATDLRWIQDLSVAGECDALAFSDSQGGVHLWRDDEIRKISTGRFHELALSPDGRLLAGSSRAVGLALWDARTGDRLLIRAEAPDAIAFSPDGSEITLLRNDTLRVLQLNVPETPEALHAWLQARADQGFTP